MKKTETFIKDLYVLEPTIFEDERGWFMESYNMKDFENDGVNIIFKQDNHSYSKKVGVLRGLHFQNSPHAQTKLVRCVGGSIFDVAVDLRKNSETFLQWYGIELSSKNKKMLLIPQGFAHGFLTLEENCEVQYKVDNFYNKKADRTIRYNDPQIKIEWPLVDVILSEKDIKAPLLEEMEIGF